MKRKKKMKMSSSEKIQDDFLLDTLNKELYTTKSPHILITRTFCHIEQNSIILHHPVVENENSRSRNISYKIKYVGKKIELHRKKKYINLRPGSSSNNVVFILIDNREMIHIPKLTLYTENGKRLDTNSNGKLKEGYILLALVTCNSLKIDKNTSWLSQEEIEMLDKFRVDKIKSKVHHHFNTTGKIFSFGYGPKYQKTGDYGYSIGKYADKTNRKKLLKQRNIR